ncbi:MAG: hypothetical protein ACJ79E_06995 [Anaeromyxobacteraceae bacterium]
MRAPLAVVVLLAVPAVALAQDEDTFGEPEQRGDRVNVVAWGGTLLDLRGDASGAGLLGGEVSYSFETLDVGVLAQEYRLDRARSSRDWTPVVLLRLEQRFETRRGLEAVLALGMGAARPNGWQAWFQFAFGLRLGLGPLFLAGEVGFEQLDLFRLAAGVGVRF